MDPNQQQPNGVPPSEPNEVPQVVPPVSPEPAPQAYGAVPVTPPVEPEAPAMPTQDVPNAFSPTPTATPDMSTPMPTFAAPVSSGPTGPIGSSSVDAAGVSSTSAPMPLSPKPKSKLGLIIGIVVGVLVLAGAGVFAFFSFMSVSASDYAAAAERYDTLNSANTSLGNDLSSLASGVSSDTDTEYEANLKSVEDTIATIKTENEALGKLKAVQVGDGKQEYEKFNTTLQKYIAYFDESIASFKLLRPAMVTCGSAGGSTSAELATSLKACAEALGKVGELPSAEFNTYVTEMHTNYTTYAETYAKRNALANPFGDDYDTYRAHTATMRTAQTAISDAGKAFKDASNKRDDDIGMADVADAFGKFLTEKANQ